MLKTLLKSGKILLIVTFLPGLITNCANLSQTKAINANQQNKTGKKTTVSPGMPADTVNETGKSPPLDLTQVKTVSYCELVRNAAEYDGQILRVRAIYYTKFEKMYLYDENCETDQPARAPEKVPAETWAEWDKSFISQGHSAEAKLNRQLNGFGRKDVTIVGRFYSTNAQKGAEKPNLFGHMGCCRFQFLIMHLDKLHTPASDEEGQTTVVSGQIEYLKESEGEIRVAVAPYAQMFILYRTDIHFEAYFELLNEAVKTKRPLQLTLQEFSGRIIKITEKR